MRKQNTSILEVQNQSKLNKNGVNEKVLERWVLFESKEKKEKSKQNGVVRKDLVEVELEPGIFKGRKAWIGRGRQHV